MTGIIQDPGGNPISIMLAARWENDPGPLRTQVIENAGSRQVPGIKLLEDGFKQGIYVRVVIEGTPAAILSVPGNPDGLPEHRQEISRFAAANPAGAFLEKILQENTLFSQDVSLTLNPGDHATPSGYQDGQMTAQVETMLAWPATPPRERLDSAQEFIRQNIPEDKDITETIQNLRASGNTGHRDAANMLEIQVNEIFGRWGANLLRENLREQGAGNKENIEEQIANCGDTPETIGAGLEFTSLEDTLQVFTRVLRDPDWMGFCPALPTIRGSSALILESPERPGQAGIILAGPHRNPRPGGTTQFPHGETQRLRSLLEWHGAMHCVWIPRRGA